MITSMDKAGMAPPVFDSDKHKNNFQLILYLHHFMDSHDIEWVSQFRELSR